MPPKLPAAKKMAVAPMLFLCLMLFAGQAPAQQAIPPVSARTDELFRSVRSGSTSDLSKQLANGADPNDRLSGYTALMAATLGGTVGQMKILIEHGAHVNDTTKGGVSSLWLALPDLEKAKLLVDHGADARQKVEGMGILVKLALMPGTEKLFHLLIENGADPKKSAPDNSLIYSAASSGDTAVLGILLRSGLSADDSISSGDRPINAALVYRSFPTVKMLIENGAKMDVRYNSSSLRSYIGITPLMFAALNYDRPSFFYLLGHGADPNLTNNKGYTALMLLQQAEIDDLEMTQALIDHGAKVSTKAADGSDALSLAEKKGKTRSVALLRKYATK